MIKYVALLRGIMPSNPNMRNEKLRGVFEDLGLKNVQTLISSGNVLFESPETDIEKLEQKIETALLQKLGFESSTIIRSQEQLQRMVDRAPFKNLEHNRQTYLLVTFLKTGQLKKMPNVPESAGYKIIANFDDAIFSVTDMTSTLPTDMMSWIEKELGKQITSRTFKTVERILAKMKKS